MADQNAGPRVSRALTRAAATTATTAARIIHIPHIVKTTAINATANPAAVTTNMTRELMGYREADDSDSFIMPGSVQWQCRPWVII
jgi:hypothetical protein